MANVAIVWFRHDLRLADHPALHQALETGARIVPLYVHCPDEAAPWTPGAASRWWLHHSLASLAQSLAQSGNRLVIRRGNSLDVLTDVINETGARSIYVHELYEPALRRRDDAIAVALDRRGISFTRVNGNLLSRPGSIATNEGAPYRVFTPYWKRFLKTWHSPEPLPAPVNIPGIDKELASLDVEALSLLPDHPWQKKLQQHWQPGETQAQKVLAALDNEPVADYPEQRDRPAAPGTTRLSAHLHFGELSPRQVANRLEQVRSQYTGYGVSAGADTILRQLVWRDFAHQVLVHFPHTTDTPMNPRFESFPWQRDDRLLGAWQRGVTGIPIVDAGMRELWQTGWMHNRVRMICASLLTKNMRIHWLEGARWFWDTLIDADLAQNTMNWQWVAGSGVDAAPYFRIFNPVTQGERFDSDGAYVRRWLPELAQLQNKWIHKPWQAPGSLLQSSGIALGEDYPLPVVDLGRSRDAALLTYRQLGKPAASQSAA